MEICKLHNFLFLWEKEASLEVRIALDQATQLIAIVAVYYTCSLRLHWITLAAAAEEEEQEGDFEFACFVLWTI